MPHRSIRRANPGKMTQGEPIAAEAISDQSAIGIRPSRATESYEDKMSLYKGITRPIRKIVVGLVTPLAGSEVRVRRLRFGPLRGKNICINFQTSPRTFLGINEPWIAELAKEYIKPGDVIYDIGAHVGYTSLLFAQVLKNTGAVYAFEILKYTTDRFLKKTVEANEFRNIHIENVGLGVSEQTLSLSIGSTAMTSIYGSDEQKQLEICQVVPIDRYVQERKIPPPALVKIDIEGAETDCLRGGHQIFNQSKPVMLIEFHSLELLKDGYELLRSWGYRLMIRGGIEVDDKFISRLERFHQTVLCKYGPAQLQPARKSH